MGLIFVCFLFVVVVVVLLLFLFVLFFFALFCFLFLVGVLGFFVCVFFYLISPTSVSSFAIFLEDNIRVGRFLETECTTHRRKRYVLKRQGNIA